VYDGVVKTCKVCGETKPLSDFYKMAEMRDGHRNDCKACNLAAKARRYRANPEPAKERVRAWQAQNADRVADYRRRYNAKPERKAQNRRSHLKRKYGITPEQYDQMLAAQGGGCAICERPPREDIALHIDHDHETGTIRLLLCFPCNNLLGDAGDDPALLEKATAYLRSHDPVVQEEVALVKARARALVPSEPNLF
jgi:5-methylcytosine-specific restriction endonuclease McrA